MLFGQHVWFQLHLHFCCHLRESLSPCAQLGAVYELPALKSTLRYGRVRLENTPFNSAFTYPARLILKIKALTSIYGNQVKKK